MTDQEKLAAIREALDEGRAEMRDGSCWCAPKPEYAEHHPTCLAAKKIWTLLPPPKEKDE